VAGPRRRASDTRRVLAYNAAPTSRLAAHSLAIEDRMKGLIEFLRKNPRAWIVPIVIFVALAVAVAWYMTRVPKSPFVYREY
jgi:hypothetical protein